LARILIVDDEADLRGLLSAALSLDDHEIVTAHDGEQALAAVRAHAVDLLLLDVMMPGRDGWWVLDQLKGSPDWQQIPIIMVTARAADLDRIQGKIAGAVRYLTKPFSVAELRATVTSVLEGPPEAEQRLHTQRQALVELARWEKGSPLAGPAMTPARPRLTRLDGAGHPGGRTTLKAAPTISRHTLSHRQYALLDAVLRAPSIRAAAGTMAISRSYLYEALGQMAEKFGVSSGPELIRKLRSGELTVT